MSTLRRAEHDLSAHAFAERSRGQLALLLADVASDLQAEVLDLRLTDREADQRIAAEMAHRLDNALEWSDIVPGSPVVGIVMEALDWFVYYLACIAVIAAWRRLERRLPMLRGRLDAAAEALLRDDLLPLRRRRLERRVKRLTRLTG